MFTVMEIKNLLNAQLIRGNENTIIERFNISNKNHYKDDFYIPIIWREDRQKYIIEAVNAGAIGYMISTKNEKKEEIIAESIKINSNIIILQVEDINEAIYKMALYKRKQNIDIPASLESMKAGLMSANMIKNCGRKIAVLGEMLELGEYSKELHMQVGEVFKKVNFDILLTQGDNTRYICEIAKKYMLENNIINFENKDNLLDYLFTEIKERDLIYLKASRKMGFDNIVRKLLDVI